MQQSLEHIDLPLQLIDTPYLLNNQQVTSLFCSLREMGKMMARRSGDTWKSDSLPAFAVIAAPSASRHSFEVSDVPAVPDR